MQNKKEGGSYGHLKDSFQTSRPSVDTSTVRARLDHRDMYEHDGNAKKNSKCCNNPVGEIARIAVTGAYSFGDWGAGFTTLLFLPIPMWAKWVISVPTVILGSAYPNYMFWANSTKKNTARLGRAIGKKCCGRNTAEREALVERERLQTVEPPVRSRAQGVGKGALFGASAFFGTLDTWALFTFFAREALVEAIGYEVAPVWVWGVSAGLCGPVAAVYYITTAQVEIYRKTYNKHEEIAPPKWIAGRYVLAFAAPLNEGVFMNYLPLYSQLHRMSGTNWVAVPFSGVISACKFVSAFYYRSEVLLRGTRLMKWMDNKVDNLSERSRKGGLAIIGGVSFITGLSQYTFAGEQILKDVFVKGFDRKIDDTTSLLVPLLVQAPIATYGDLTSEYAQTVVEVMKLDPDPQRQAIQLEEVHVDHGQSPTNNGPPMK